MGGLTASGSLARVLGPIFVSYIYQYYGTYWTFGLETGSMVISALITLLAYKRLVPMVTGVNPMENEYDDVRL